MLVIQKLVSPVFCISRLLFFFLKMIENLYPSAEKAMSPCPATLSYADLSPAVQYQPIHHANSFFPSILPLFVMSELVMNFTDFLGFFGGKECTVVLTKCGKLLSLRTSWESNMVLLWSCKGLGKNIVEETLSVSFLKI